MGHGGAHRAPYFAACALAAWAVLHRPYIRGRLLLAGLRFHELDAAEVINLAEAIVMEPALNGSWTSFDEVYKELSAGYRSTQPSEQRVRDEVENFGRTADAIESSRRMEQLFPMASPRSDQ